MDKPPSLLEVLYPPKQAGTRSYVPAYAPVESEQDKYYRNANWFFGMVRGLCLGVSIVILTPIALVLLAVLLSLSTSLVR